MKKNITHCLSKHSIFSTGLILTIITCLLSCKEGSDEPTVTKLAVEGTYTVTSAKLAKDITVDGKNIQKEKELAEYIKLILFSKIECKDKNNSAINLKDDKKLYVTCSGETPTNEKQGGTWTADGKNLTLNVAPPIVVQAFNMSIENVKIENNVLSGTGKSIPVPNWVLKGTLPILEDPNKLTLVELNLTFQKK